MTLKAPPAAVHLTFHKIAVLHSCNHGQSSGRETTALSSTPSSKTGKRWLAGWY